MHGEMNQREIDDFVASQKIARLGCHAEGRTYVIPITYVSNPDAIYSPTKEGMKLRMMRTNPDVCLEFEELNGPFAWKTVVAWGRFELLSGDEAADAYRRFLARVVPKWDGVGSLSEGEMMYRIVLGERTGRFERPD